MKFIQDLIEDFLACRDRYLTDIHSYLSGVGHTITKLTTHKDEEWTFINADEIKIKRLKGAKSEAEINMLWQNYLVGKTKGFQHDTFLHGFIEKNQKSLFWKLGTLTNKEDRQLEAMTYIEDFADAEIQHLLGLEEIRFSDNLNGCRHEVDFVLLSRGLEEIAAYYNSEIHNVITEFLDELPQTINENGEQVYEFTEGKLAAYERLKEIKETIDFTFRYQKYRADQKEEEFLSQQSI